MKLRNIFLLITIITIVFWACKHELKTPAENTNFKKITSNSKVIEFINQAILTNPEISIKGAGKSAGGKIISLVSISLKKETTKPKVKVFIMGQTHGNEPSGLEACLLLIKYFAENKNSELLDNIDLYIIPQLNPDGGDKHQRKNADNTDINRNHLILTAPEAKFAQKTFNELLPEVTIDIHEYYPFYDTTETFKYVKSNDIQFGALTNMNVDSEILNLSNKKILPYVISYVQKKGYSCKEYAVGSVRQDNKLRTSTTDINDGRQSFGIQNTFSFIFEGLNGRDSLDRLHTRALSQFEGIMAVLHYVSENSSNILQITHNARNALIDEKYRDTVFLQQEHTKNPVSHKMLMKDFNKGKDTLIDLLNYNSIIKSNYNTKSPKAYLIPANDSVLVRFLNNHSIKYSDYNFDKKDYITEYQLIKIKKDTMEELPTYNPEVLLKKIDKLKDNYYIVPLNQLKVYTIILAFEPKSMYCLTNYDEFEYLLKNRKNYPVLRIEK